MRFRKLPRTALALLAIAAVSVATANAFVIARATPSIVDTVDAAPSRTVAIVPGARVYADGTPSPILRDRLETARALFAAGRVTRILVSGDHSRADYDEVNAMHRWLVANGVPSDAIYLDHAGLRTLDTMARARQVFGVRDAIVCTQRFHLARSLFLAEAAGIDAVGVVSDRSVYPGRRVDAVREVLARSRALLDRYVLHTQPRSLGEAIPIDGPATATHDANTRPTT